jgi:hypothetical protein
MKTVIAMIKQKKGVSVAKTATVMSKKKYETSVAKTVTVKKTRPVSLIKRK